MNIFDSWLCKQYIAHHGLHDEEAPENSLAAFEKAINKGYAIEFDVRVIADGTLVVFNDETLGRMTGADGFISNYTYDDIKDLKLAKSDQHIPTFEEALNFIAGRTPILVEIKNTGKVGFEKDVWKLLKQYKGEYAVQSFNPYTLEWFKINAPHVRRGQLSSFFTHEDLGFFKRRILRKMAFNKKVSEPNFISYNAENLPNRYVKKYPDLPVLAWIVKNQKDYDRVKKVCNNIIFEGFDPQA